MDADPPASAAESARALQRELQRVRMAVDAAEVGIWERDLQGRVVYWNETMYLQRGCTSRDARSPELIMAQTTHPDDHQALQAAYSHGLAHGRTYRQELRLILPDGNQRWLITEGRPLRDAQGRVVGMAGVNIDITAQKQAALLKADKARAEQDSREKSLFMARTGHELRAPLNAVLGFSQLMREDTGHPLPAPQLQRLKLIEEAGLRLLGLIDGLLQNSLPAAAAQPAVSPADGEAKDPVAATEPTSPAAEVIAPIAAAVPEDPAVPAAATQYLHVLCVEDNPVNMLLITEVLRMRPEVRLSTAEDGLSGVAAALQDPPDVLLLDQHLPDISGQEVFRRLKGQPGLAACRFIALSADGMAESIAAARAAGFDDYWTKPIRFDHFLGQIDQLIQAQQKRS